MNIQLPHIHQSPENPGALLFIGNSNCFMGIVHMDNNLNGIKWILQSNDNVNDIVGHPHSMQETAYITTIVTNSHQT